MARKPQTSSVEVKPSQGGRLMSSLSSESPGIQDYSVKRDWRRYMDREIRAEGHRNILLAPLVDPDIQAVPNGSSTPITLIAEARRGDGKKTIVCGNKTTLWAYTALDDSHYAISDDLVTYDYFANDDGNYVDEVQYGWIQIAAGLSEDGRRWEAESVGDYIVLNNGVDLPMTYRPGDLTAKPIYELREQGVASVGTIAFDSGNLLCCDLWQINDIDFEELMAPIQGSASAGQNSYGAVSVGPDTLFPGVSVTPGLTLFWDNGRAAKVRSISPAVANLVSGSWPDASVIGPEPIPVTGFVIGQKYAYTPGNEVGLFTQNGVSELGFFDELLNPVTPFDSVLYWPPPSSQYRLQDSVVIQSLTTPGEVYQYVNGNEYWIASSFSKEITGNIPYQQVHYYPSTNQPSPGRFTSFSSQYCMEGYSTTHTQPNPITAKIYHLAIPSSGSIPAGEFVATQETYYLIGTQRDAEATAVISTDATIFTWCSEEIDADVVRIENVNSYAAFTSKAKMQRFPWRILPSMTGKPRRFGSIIPCSASLNDTKLKFSYPVKSLPELVALNQVGKYAGGGLVGGATNITVLRAGVSGSTITTSVIAINDGIAMNCDIFDKVMSPITEKDPDGNSFSSLESTDAVNSYAGTYIDLVGDGGAIQKALALRDQIVVYKDTSFIYMGKFTGDTVNPYQFSQIAVKNDGQILRYRNCIVSSGGGFYGSCHVYAGRNAFYKFDLYTQEPVEIPELTVSQDIFFSNAIKDPDNAWAAENPLTREWMFGWDGVENGVDKALCVDYALKTVRTASADISAASSIQHPTRGDWIFAFGTSDGTIQQYGLTDAPVESPECTATISDGVITTSTEFWTVDHIGKSIVLSNGNVVAIVGVNSDTEAEFVGDAKAANLKFSVVPAIWHRNGESYDSVIQTGAGDLGSADNGKLVTRYVPIASSKIFNAPVVAIPATNLNVSFKDGINPQAIAENGQSATVTMPNNLIQPTFMGYYVGVNLKISGINNPFELSNQVWSATLIGDQSAGRL